MEYIVETPYSYQFFPCKTLCEAKEKKAELRKKKDGRDYIIE